jgi:hypothetical protein
VELDKSAVAAIVEALADASAQVDGSVATPSFGPRSCGAAFAEQVSGYPNGVHAVVATLHGMRDEAGSFAETVAADLAVIESVDRTTTI